MKNKSNNYDQAFYGHPKPLRGLFFTELWERFSFYGVRPLLVLYMAAMVSQGGLGLDLPTASAIVGLFAGSMYLMTVFGGWIADNWLGQARAVWYGSIIMALGHLSIALTAISSNFFFYFGLVLIVLGSGLFKTCISVIVGTLYEAKDSRRDAGFSIFYMGINLGSFVAPLITGFLVKDYGWHLGFGAGGIGMLVALMLFRSIAVPELTEFSKVKPIDNSWKQATNQNPHAPKIVVGFLAICAVVITLTTMGIVTINPVEIVTYLTIIICITIIGYFAYLLLFSKTTVKEKQKLVICFILLIIAALFWSAFEQSATSLNLFAQDFTTKYFMGFEVPAVWFQSINPLFVIIFAPIMAWLWVKLGKSNKDPSYISKFIIALVLAASGFGLMALASHSVIASGGALVSPWWLISTFFLLTMGELCLSPVGLSTMTKLAPRIIRGQVMGLWFTASALGNLMAGLIGGHVSQDSLQDLPTLFIRCVVALMIGAIVLLIIKKPVLKLISDSDDKRTETETI